MAAPLFLAGCGGSQGTSGADSAGAPSSSDPASATSTASSGSAEAVGPDPCDLLPAQAASKLLGATVTAHSSDYSDVGAPAVHECGYRNDDPDVPILTVQVGPATDPSAVASKLAGAGPAPRTVQVAGVGPVSEVQDADASFPGVTLLATLDGQQDSYNLTVVVLADSLAHAERLATEALTEAAAAD